MQLPQQRLLARLFMMTCAFTYALPGVHAAAPPMVADAQIAFASGLGSPQGIAVANNGTIYVADTGNNRVVTISSTGVLTPVNTPGFTLSSPSAVAVDSTGNLYIADSNSVYELPPGSSIAQSVTPSGYTLSSPAGLGFDLAAISSFWIHSTSALSRCRQRTQRTHTWSLSPGSALRAVWLSTPRGTSTLRM
jgi:NHL repeat